MKGMCVRLTTPVLFCVFVFTASFASAGVDPAAQCKFRKLNGAGAGVYQLIKAFAKNKKEGNVIKFHQNISKAQSRLALRYTRAEFSPAGVPRGCQTVDDVADIQVEVENSVQTFLGLLCPTSTTSTTLP